MTKIGDEINSLLDELTQEYGLDERQPSDVSVKDMADATGLGVRWCAEKLAEKVVLGKLIKVRVMGDHNKPIYVFRKVESPVPKY